MSFLLKTAVRWSGKPLAQRLDAATAEPEVAQRSLLQQFLTRNANTCFGREHRFSQLQTEQDYRGAVPIRDYEGFRPYINRMVAGEDQILTDAPPLMFTLTSGTTGAPKYIPVTEASDRAGSDLMRQWLYRILNDHPQALDRSTLGIVSSAIEGYTAGGIPYGSLSGRIYQKIPAIVRRSYAVPYPVFELKDYQERYLAIARFALARQISFLSTPNPSTLLRLVAIASESQETIIRAIHDGTVGCQFPKQPELVKQLQKQLRPDRDRAKVLEKIATTTGKLLPKDCWPHLKLIGCWTGGSVGIQAQKLAASFGHVPIRDLGYLASEGRITLPVQDNTNAGILALHTNYYEFIPEAELESDAPTVLLSHQLEVGQRYGILLTTAAGLYRYDINDIVEVTGFYRRTPLIAFVRKGKDMANLTGEKMHVNHILLAMSQVQQQFALPVGVYRMVPNLEEMRYDLYLELTEGRSPTWLQDTILPAIDAALAQVNLEYAQKRLSRRLNPLCLYIMRSGWAEAECRQAIAQSQRDAQHKWKVLCSQPGLAEQGTVVTVLQNQREYF